MNKDESFYYVKELILNYISNGIMPMNKNIDNWLKIIYYVSDRLLENPDIFINNLLILDKYAENGSVANLERKMNNKR